MKNVHEMTCYVHENAENYSLELLLILLHWNCGILVYYTCNTYQLGLFAVR